MNVLIAGTGFIGEPLGDALAGDGHQVHGITFSEESAERISREKRWQVSAADLSEADSLALVKDSLGWAPDAVVHCASSGRGGVARYEAVYERGCANLLAVFRGAPLLFTGSTSVYAQVDGSLVDEVSPAEPDRDTGKCLRRTEKLVCEGGGTVARLAGIYGPGRSFILKKFLEKTAVIEGDGGRFVNQAHRDDIVSALCRLLERRQEIGGEIFNVVDSQPQTQLDIYQWLAEYFHCSLPETAPPDYERKRGWTHKRVSNKKLCHLGWVPRYPSFQKAVVEDDRIVSSIRERISDSE